MLDGNKDFFEFKLSRAVNVHEEGSLTKATRIKIYSPSAIISNKVGAIHKEYALAQFSFLERVTKFQDNEVIKKINEQKEEAASTKTEDSSLKQTEDGIDTEEKVLGITQVISFMNLEVVYPIFNSILVDHNKAAFKNVLITDTGYEVPLNEAHLKVIDYRDLQNIFKEYIVNFMVGS